MAKQVMGVIEFDWSTRVLLPLEEAHKIQAILAKHAVSIERAYDSENNLVLYMAEFAVPAVQARKDDIQWDARGLSKEQARRWVDAVKEMPPNGTIIDPQSFAAIYGEDNE
jgi:hypothetical protein